MTDDEREALASWLERGTGSDAEKRRQSHRVAAQLRADGERIKALEAERHAADSLDAAPRPAQGDWQ